MGAATKGADIMRTADQESSETFSSILTQSALDSGWSTRFMTDKGPALIRLYPSLDAAWNPEPQIRPEIGVPTPEAISDFITEYNMAVMTGKTKYTGIVDTLDSVPGARKGLYDTMVASARKRIKQSPLQCSQEMHDLFGETKGRPQVSFGRRTVFFRGTLLMLDGALILNNRREPDVLPRVVLRMTSSTGAKELREGLLTVVDEAYALSGDNSVLGDLVTPERGRPLEVYIKSEWQEDKGQNQNVYHVRASNEIYPMDLEEIRDLYGDHRAWDSLLKVPTMEELMEFMVGMVGKATLHACLSDSAYVDLLPPAETIHTAPRGAPPPAAAPRPAMRVPAQAPRQPAVVRRADPGRLPEVGEPLDSEYEATGDEAVQQPQAAPAQAPMRVPAAIRQAMTGAERTYAPKGPAPAARPAAVQAPAARPAAPAPARNPAAAPRPAQAAQAPAPRPAQAPAPRPAAGRPAAPAAARTAAPAPRPAQAAPPPAPRPAQGFCPQPPAPARVPAYSPVNMVAEDEPQLDMESLQRQLDAAQARLKAQAAPPAPANVEFADDQIPAGSDEPPEEAGESEEEVSDGAGELL